MKCAKVMELISQYVDGELSAQQMAVVEGHIEGCTECQSVFADFKKIKEEAQDLEVLEPPDRGWDRLKREWETAVQAAGRDFFRRKRWLFLPAFRPAVVVGAVLILILTVGLLTVGPGLWKKGISAGNREDTVLAKLEEAEEHYKMAIKSLGEALAASEKDMNPQLLEVLKVNLEVIDMSLNAYKAAVLDDPEDIDTRKFLLAVYRQKMDLLSTIITVGVGNPAKTETKSTS